MFCFIFSNSCLPLFSSFLTSTWTLTSIQFNSIPSRTILNSITIVHSNSSPPAFPASSFPWWWPELCGEAFVFLILYLAPDPGDKLLPSFQQRTRETDRRELGHIWLTRGYRWTLKWSRSMAKFGTLCVRLRNLSLSLSRIYCSVFTFSLSILGICVW